jgi:hypothetical protein
MVWGGAAILATTVVACATMTAIGPLVFGLSLIVCELRAQGFRKVLRPADLLAPGAPLGEVLGGLDAAQARARQEGRRLGLPQLDDGYYFDDRGGGEALNLRLARILVARRQLAHDYRVAAEAWAQAYASRDVARAGGLLLVAVILMLCAGEPAGAALLWFTGGEPGLLRLAASLLGAGAALAGMSRAGRIAARARIEATGLQPLRRARIEPQAVWA